MTPEIKVLLIEDVPKYARLMKDMLQQYRGTQFTLEWADTFDGGLQKLADNEPDVLLLDLAVAAARGNSTVPDLLHAAPHLPLIILSSLDDEDSALKAVHQGAQDYLVQGEIDTHLLVRSIRYAIERKRAELALHQAEEKYRSIFEKSKEAVFTTDLSLLFKDVNTAMVNLESVLPTKQQGDKAGWHSQTRDGERESDETILRRLIERHFKHTGSTRARNLLDDWANSRTKFVKVFPTDYKRALEEMHNSSMEEANDKIEMAA